MLKIEKKWDSVGTQVGYGCFLQDVNGHLGGIWVLSFRFIDQQQQAITFCLCRRNVKWTCFVIYASSTPTARVAIWDHLSVLSVSIIGPWSLLGQFNEIISPSKVVGGSFHASKAILMINMMTSCGLLYMETMGGSFTWWKDTQNGGHIRQKLDRVLLNPKWHISFTQALVETLPRHNSDHNPMLLSYFKSHSKKLRSFQIQGTWMSHPDYSPLVRNTWQDAKGSIPYKLGRIQMKSKEFNEKVFRNIFHNKKKLESHIKGVYQQLEWRQDHSLIMLEKIFKVNIIIS